MESRTLRATWRALETGLRKPLTGHEGGNAGNRQGVSFGSPRQRSTLPGNVLHGEGVSLAIGRRVKAVRFRESVTEAWLKRRFLSPIQASTICMPLA
jgi:hypothetical protein